MEEPNREDRDNQKRKKNKIKVMRNKMMSKGKDQTNGTGDMPGPSTQRSPTDRIKRKDKGKRTSRRGTKKLRHIERPQSIH
jgi:hypothetical protein